MITRDDSGLQRSFDWKPRFDDRSRNYPMRALLDPTIATTTLRQSSFWKPGEILDQGSEGACVGFGWTQEAIMSPVRVPLANLARADLGSPKPPVTGNEIALGIYRSARRVDEWDGESYEGTSVLAGAKVMSGLGVIREYRWCFTITDVIDTLLLHGPVVLGINWHSSMYHPDIYGELYVSGPIVGGHCIVANGYHAAKRMHPASGMPPRPMIHLTNSWGFNWGYDGGAWVTVDMLANLLLDGGEACVPVHRGYGAAADL